MSAVDLAATARFGLLPDEDLEAARTRFEALLEEKRLPIPIQHRALWAATIGAERSGLIRCGSREEGSARVLFVEASRTRALPGHWILRVPRVGGFVPASTLRPGLAALLAHARRSRVLRVVVEIFERDEGRRAELVELARSLGLRRNAEPRGYEDTLVVDLARSRDQLLASFSRRCRRGIRKIENAPYSVRVVEDASYDRRISDLVRETMGRTHSSVSNGDWSWARVRALGAADPESSRLVGLFDDRVDGPRSLLAVAWGLREGDHAVYEVGASTRVPDVNVPLGYALMWDLMGWAQEAGAGWFDLGGSWSDPDPAVAGIEEFKRSFSPEEAAVREEWIFEPHRGRARLARALSRLAPRRGPTG